jgi:carbon monoxide dehydrogenase subunit G
MRIEQVRQIGVPISEVWDFFDDVQRVVECMPGATLTKVVDERTFEGVLGMKVGPISVRYSGSIVIDEKDGDARILRMTGSGKDAKGAGTAQATIVAELSESEDRVTALAVRSDVRLTGRVASLGRGMQDVATKLFEDFARRVEEELTAPPPAPAVEFGDRHVQTDSAERVKDSSTDGGRPAPARRAGNEIKVLPLLWSLVKDKVRGIFTTSRRRRVGGKD